MATGGKPPWAPQLAGHLNARRAPIIEQLAAELQGTGGTISTQKHGVVYRGLYGIAQEAWNMAHEWRGAELTNYNTRFSSWSKTIVVRFYVESPGVAGRVSAFSLHLHPPLTDAEIAQMAETYMLVLNLRRLE